jgi:hypothetical protein
MDSIHLSWGIAHHAKLANLSGIDSHPSPQNELMSNPPKLDRQKRFNLNGLALEGLKTRFGEPFRGPLFE